MKRRNATTHRREEGEGRGFAHREPLRLRLFALNSALAALALMQAAPVAAQSASAPGYAFEITSTDRWLHARQSPAFTPWSDADIPRWLRVDSVLPGPSSGTRALRIRRNFPSDRTHLRLVHDTLGTVRSLVSTYPERAVLPGQEFFDAMMARGSARSGSGR